MNAFQSLIFHQNRLVEDGMDLALVYANANKESLTEFLEDKKSALEGVMEKLTALRKKKSFLPGTVIIAISAIVLTIYIIWGTFGTESKVAIGGIVAGALCIALAVWRKKKNLKKLEIEQRLIEAREAPNVVSQIGKMYSMVEVIPFEGGKMVVDCSNMREKTKFVYPGIPNSVDSFNEILKEMRQLPQELPVFLPSIPQSELQESGILAGVEGNMANILRINQEILGRKIESITEVPAFFFDSDVVRSLHVLSPFLEAHQPGHMVYQTEEPPVNSMEQLKAINENAKEISKLGSQNDENMLQNIRNKMFSMVKKTKSVRDYSLIDILEGNLDQLRPLYDYPLTRFYCPKCHKVNSYIADKMPVPIDELNERPVEQLRGFYKSEEIIYFRKLVDTIILHLEHAGREGENLDNEHYQLLKEKLSLYKTKMRDFAFEIEGVDPIAEVHSRNAVLKYNTTLNLWKCQLCGESFTTEEAQWARILKIKDDLILPLWDKLWMEKHDETVRIIGEKERELRKNKELESRQLRAEADVFTQDYRAIRNQLEEANADYQGCREQFVRMCEFFEKQHILSQESVKSMENDIMPIGNSTDFFEQIIMESDRNESYLEQEPEAVFLRRGNLVNYIEAVRNMQKYFEPVVNRLPVIEAANPVIENPTQNQ